MSHIFTHIFLFRKVGRMYFLNLGVKGLKGEFTLDQYWENGATLVRYWYRLQNLGIDFKIVLHMTWMKFRFICRSRGTGKSAENPRTTWLQNVRRPGCQATSSWSVALEILALIKPSVLATRLRATSSSSLWRVEARHCSRGTRVTSLLCLDSSMSLRKLQSKAGTHQQIQVCHWVNMQMTSLPCGVRRHSDVNQYNSKWKSA